MKTQAQTRTRTQARKVFRDRISVYIVVGRDGRYYVYAGAFRVAIFRKLPTADEIKQYMLQYGWIKPDVDVVIKEIVTYE